MITAKPIHPHRDPITIAVISPEAETKLYILRELIEKIKTI